MGLSWALLELSGLSWGSLGPPQELPWALLGLSWGLLELSWSYLGALLELSWAYRRSSQKTAKNNYPWKPEKDECFERGLDFTENPQRFGSILGPFWGPFWASFSVFFPSFLRAFLGPISGAILGPFWSHFGAHFGARSAQWTSETSPRAP